MKISLDDYGYLIYAMKDGEYDMDYDALTDVIKQKPEQIEGYDWKLKYPEMEWISEKLPPEDISEDEAFRIMLGGEE